MNISIITITIIINKHIIIIITINNKSSSSNHQDQQEPEQYCHYNGSAQRTVNRIFIIYIIKQQGWHE